MEHAWSVYLVAGLVLAAVFSAMAAFRLASAGSGRLRERLGLLEKGVEKLEAAIRSEVAALRGDVEKSAREQRQELAGTVKDVGDTLRASLQQVTDLHKDKLQEISRVLSEMTRTSDRRMEDLRQAVDKNLAEIWKRTEASLEKIEEKVDKELHETLEHRLGESFKLVSERLEKVQHGLGEMQELARGVGDLKKVLTNVKTRGTWGEVQLGMLLEQVMASAQYEANAQVKPNTRERVEFAIKLPGTGDGTVLLPVDSKFPVEDYQRLVEASQRGDPEEAREAEKRLVHAVKENAKKINEKYIYPPRTTDFAVMYLPVEGLYAEVLRVPGLVEELQSKWRVTVAGPATLVAFLNSLQMGFVTLAIKERARDVWSLLKKVKQDIAKFGTELDKAAGYIAKAGDTVEKAVKRTARLERSLQDLESLPEQEGPAAMLPDGSGET